MIRRYSSVKYCVLAMSLVNVAYATNWTGLYAGAELGIAVNDIQLNAEHLGFSIPGEHYNLNEHSSTFFPGLQLGYAHQFANTLVTGLEVTFTLNANKESDIGYHCPINPWVSDRFSLDDSWQSTVKARVGRALNWNEKSILPYLTTGVSFANLKIAYRNEGGDNYNQNDTTAGWLLGAGIEWAYNPHWTLRAEYSFMDYGNKIEMNLPILYGIEDPNGFARANLNTNTISLAINYWV